MVVLLKKLTYGALLSPSEASEEFREGIILCFRALLLNLHPCSNASCSCEQIPGLPALSEDTNDSNHWRSFKSTAGSEVCLLDFLRSQAASAAIGHWLSLLLKVCLFLCCRVFRCKLKWICFLNFMWWKNNQNLSLAFII